MTSVTLTLEEIRKRRRKARQEGRHEALRVWEDLERRAEREDESEAPGGVIREVREVLTDPELSDRRAVVRAVDILETGG